MPLPALLLIIATLLPLGSFVLLMFVGKRMGRPLAGIVGTCAIGTSCLLSLWALVKWMSETHAAWGYEKGPINLPLPWVPVNLVGLAGKWALEIGVYVDSVTIVMFCMVTFVSTIVHVFSIGYMAEDKRFARFFTYLGLFCFSMLGLVIGGTILQLFIFWELVGLCSYLLIGFWYEKKSASNAAIKAFVTNRIGDFGFLIGLGILFYHLGNVTLPEVWGLLDASQLKDAAAGGIKLADGSIFTYGLLTVMGIGLFFGAVGKSAQFPLHVWLPDAMEGPTPVSALIHAATMVAAGVYLVARIFPILTPDARLFIATIGCVTLTMAALIAIAQSDIKKVLAYSTLSQLGYMILAMGIGSWVGGLFHLITHAFFKALLFLGSGSVIHAAHHEQELPQYGGLWRKTPMTALTFLIAVLAIAGVPGLAGFYSKDLILANAASFSLLASRGSQGGGLYWLLFILPACIAYVTAFYMMRCWMLTFWGKPRNQHLHDHAHESPILWIPLVFLAIMSIIGGYEMTNIKGLIKTAIGESTQYVQAHHNRNFDGFSLAWPSAMPTAEELHEGLAGHGGQHSEPPYFYEGWELVHKFVAWAPWIGMGIGFLLYMNGYAVASRLMKIAPLRWIHTWLYRRMYFDELYNLLLVGLTLALSRISAAIDRYIIDAIVNGVALLVKLISDLVGLNDRYVVDGAVDGLAGAAQGLGAAVRAPQTGRIRLYVTMLLGFVALGIAAAVIVVLMS